MLFALFHREQLTCYLYRHPPRGGGWARLGSPPMSSSELAQWSPVSHPPFGSTLPALPLFSAPVGYLDKLPGPLASDWVWPGGNSSKNMKAALAHLIQLVGHRLVHRKVASSIPGQAHAWIWGSIPCRGCAGGCRSLFHSHIDVSLSPFLYL